MSLSPSMDLSAVSPLPQTVVFQLSLTRLSELSHNYLWVREKILWDNIQPSDIATLVTETETETLKAGKYSTQLVPGLSGD